MATRHQHGWMDVPGRYASGAIDDLLYDHRALPLLTNSGASRSESGRARATEPASNDGVEGAFHVPLQRSCLGAPNVEHVAVDPSKQSKEKPKRALLLLLCMTQKGLLGSGFVSIDSSSPGLCCAHRVLEEMIQ